MDYKLVILLLIKHQETALGIKTSSAIPTQDTLLTENAPLFVAKLK